MQSSDAWEPWSDQEVDMACAANAATEEFDREPVKPFSPWLATPSTSTLDHSVHGDLIEPEIYDALDMQRFYDPQRNASKLFRPWEPEPPRSLEFGAGKATKRYDLSSTSYRHPTSSDPMPSDAERDAANKKATEDDLRSFDKIPADMELKLIERREVGPQVHYYYKMVAKKNNV
jgi:hypothetical protein